MATYDLINSRMVNHSAKHGLTKDGIFVKSGGYTELYHYVLETAQDSDWYQETGPNKDWKGCTVAELRKERDWQNRVLYG